jgi:fibronectin-binding autotransporter adhesin
MTLVAAAGLRAQVVNDSATNTLSNVTNTLTGDVTVGTNGSFTLLVLSNNVLLTNSANGFIGLNATARSNEVRLLSPSARWVMGNRLTVGSSGSFNRLVASNGAAVRSYESYLGPFASGSNNTAVVTGSGSVWSNGNLFYLGFNGPGNRLVVSNGGAIQDNWSYVGYYSSNNQAVVTGAGSVWSNSNIFYLGYGGAANQVVVSNGGVLRSVQGPLGGLPSSSNNVAIVTGAGSLWTNSSDLRVGESGAGNQLIVSAGGAVRNGLGYVGRTSFASNNLALITGTGSLWSNAFELYLGSGGAGNQLLVTNGGIVRDLLSYVGVNSTSSNNRAVVTGVGSVWTNAFELYLGADGAGNQLVVSNGGCVQNSIGTVGSSGSSSNNLILVTGSGSVWSNTFEFYFGFGGTGNQLVVSNGGVVLNSLGTVGHSVASSNNLAVVTGAGSVWSNASELYLGNAGAGNQLIVSNGGIVASASSSVGVNFSSSNNLAVVSGAGSLWNSGASLLVGPSAAGNRLMVSNGGVARNVNGFLGQFPGGSNNLAVVTGSGSLWSNTSGLFIGHLGGANQLVASNGGAVFAGFNLVLGAEASSPRNRVVVDAGTLHVRKGLFNSGASALDIRRGTNVFNSGLIDADWLVMTNAAGFFEFNGGTLVTRGAVISNGAPFVVGRAGANPAIWDVGTGTTNHVLAGDLMVGGSGSFNWLVISNGGLLGNSNGFLGFNASSSNNTALVTGAGSLWTNRGFLHVGESGGGGRLVVSNGATVAVAGAGFIGWNSGAASNTVIVTDAGSRWAGGPGASLFVGVASGGNRLEVRNGAQVSSGFVTLGSASSANSNQVLVTGAGSTWSNQVDLLVGEGGSANLLVVSNAGRLVNNNGFVGDFGTRNAVLVTGPNSTWRSSADTRVGYNSSSNRLTISDGGTVLTEGIGSVGFSSGANSNTTTVTGAGSSWSNASAVFVGLNGAGGQLVVSNGATVSTTGIGSIGANIGANVNSAIVTDPGTRWLLSSNLYVGSNGPLSLLVISNGALVGNALGTIGYNGSSSNNVAVVTGPGSVWSNATDLFVGLIGRGNQLVVSNGAVVRNNLGEVGRGSTSDNMAWVTGPGSVWNNAASLNIGRSGSFNQLVVSNGGLVLNDNSYFSTSSSASNNLALVTGSGSVWSNAASLLLGEDGRGNRLVVTNGGVLRDAYGYFGFNATSRSNVAVVTGSGSRWHNANELYVGYSGAANQLVVSNSGTVFAGNAAYLGVAPAATNNRIEINGGSLLVSNSFGTGLFELRGGTNLLSAGLVEVDRLLVTNTLGFFEFGGGTLNTRGTAISNGRVFAVGNGTSAAALKLRGGTHDFANNLLIANNASLLGDGTVLGTLAVQSGGTLAPGASVGKLVLSNSPTLQGATVMEISRNGASLTNDQIQVAGPLAYGGSLTVTSIGADALALGDRFPLFSASNYSGSFSNISLPALPAGFEWTNKLAVDGSLEVVLPPTTLTFQRSNNVLTMSWPTSAASYCLETAFDLAPPVFWQPITSGISIRASSFVFSLTNTPGIARQFFRLAFPCSAVPAPVSLSIQLSNNLVTVSWPSNAFRLEKAFALAPPASWQTVSQGISNDGPLRTFTFTNNPAITNQSFRLAFP